MDVRVVIVTAFPPELAGWIPAIPLDESIPWPAGLEPGGTPLRVNRSLGIVGFSSGMGPARAAASVSMLGNDARFNLTRAYWMVAGIAGVDPTYGSVGSVFLPHYLIGLGGDYFLDGVGHVPHGRSSPDYSPPYPSRSEAEMRGHLHLLNRALIRWAFERASTAHIPDTDNLRRARAQYVEQAARLPPAVRYGDSVSGETFWVGHASTSWARNWTRFWSGGHATYAVTQEEDMAFAASLTALSRAGRANATQLIVLRSASDYCYQPAGDSLRRWFFEDALHMLHDEPFSALVAAGMPIVRALSSRSSQKQPPPASLPPGSLPPAVSPPARLLPSRAGPNAVSSITVPLWIVGVVASTWCLTLLLLITACMSRQRGRGMRREHPKPTSARTTELRHVTLKDEDDLRQGLPPA